jgi:hypothetical protein
VHVLEQDRELVAAEPGRGVAFAEAATQPSVISRSSASPAA